jgi:hypothetical protein
MVWRFENFAVDVGRTSLGSRADSDEPHFTSIYKRSSENKACKRKLCDYSQM